MKLRGGGEKSVSLANIARGVAGLPGYYIPGGVEPGLAATEHAVINDMTYANGTAVVEVEVDVETGDARVTRVVFAHDCGNVLHPKIVEGQIVGGIAHGVGNALYEWMGFDENGQPTTMTLGDYLLVSATEMPPPVEIIHLESPTPLNALGIKGVGESGVIPMTAAIASAIEDALSPFGARINKVPLAPHEILACVHKARP